MDTIQTQLYRELDNGVELKASFLDSDIVMTFVVGDTDFDRIPSLYDPVRFESGHMHVSQLEAGTDIESEISDIVSLAQSGDTILFFCQTQKILQDALAAVGYPQQPLS